MNAVHRQHNPVTKGDWIERGEIRSNIDGRRVDSNDVIDIEHLEPGVCFGD